MHVELINATIGNVKDPNKASLHVKQMESSVKVNQIKQPETYKATISAKDIRVCYLYFEEKWLNTTISN